MELMRYTDLEEYLGVPKRTIQKWVQDGNFPKPIRLSPRKPVWDREQISVWLEGKKEKAVSKTKLEG